MNFYNQFLAPYHLHGLSVTVSDAPAMSVSVLQPRMWGVKESQTVQTLVLDWLRLLRI